MTLLLFRMKHVPPRIYQSGPFHDQGTRSRLCECCTAKGCESFGRLQGCCVCCCTHLPGRDDLRRPWNPHRCVDASVRIVSKLDGCSYGGRSLVWGLFWRRFPLNSASAASAASAVFCSRQSCCCCLILHISWLFLPRKKSLLEVGSYPWMLTAVPRRRRVGLSVPVGPQPVIWGSSAGLGFPVSGREGAELPVSAFWSFDSYVSKPSCSITLTLVWW